MNRTWWDELIFFTTDKEYRLFNFLDVLGIIPVTVASLKMWQYRFKLFNFHWIGKKKGRGGGQRKGSTQHHTQCQPWEVEFKKWTTTLCVCEAKSRHDEDGLTNNFEDEMRWDEMRWDEMRWNWTWLTNHIVNAGESIFKDQSTHLTLSELDSSMLTSADRNETKRNETNPFQILWYKRRSYSSTQWLTIDDDFAVVIYKYFHEKKQKQKTKNKNNHHIHPITPLIQQTNSGSISVRERM